MKTCLRCSHVVYEQGTEGWADSCPGSDTVLRCGLEKWNIFLIDGVRELADTLETANTCAEYMEYKEESRGS